MQQWKQRTAACIRCRQMKLRCDRSERFPASCSRCERTDSHCSYDPNFKRTRKRQRLDEVERELAHIKQRLDSSATSAEHDARSPHHMHHNTSPAGYPSCSGSTHTQDQQTASPSSVVQDIRMNLSPRILGQVELSPQLIGDLVEEYYANYHDRMPILPDISAFIKYTDESLLLFWTVMLVSLRNRSEQRDVYFLLATSVQAIACDFSSPESRTLHSIQALVLLCCWKLPFGATRDDHSDTFAALACQYGYRLGLHRPRHPGDFEYNAVWDEQTTILRRKTWAGCFIACQGISATGIPVPIRFDHSLLEVLTSRPNWIPDAIFYQLHVSRKSYEICNALGGNDMTSHGLLPNALATLRVFDADLRAHEHSFSKSWTKQDLIYFLWPRLLLCIFALFEGDDQKATSPPDLNHWLALGYTTATTVIRTAFSISDQIPYIASHLRKCLVNSMFLLLKIMGSPWRQFVDESTVQNCISQGWNMLKSCSLVEHDTMSRTCAVIEYLSNGPQTMEHTLANTTLSVKSRFGANLRLDAVFQARDRFSQSVRDQLPLDYTQAAIQESLLNSVIHQVPTILPNVDGISDVDWNAIFDDLCAT